MQISIKIMTIKLKHKKITMIIIINNIINDNNIYNNYDNYNFKEIIIVIMKCDYLMH